MIKLYIYFKNLFLEISNTYLPLKFEDCNTLNTLNFLPCKNSPAILKTYVVQIGLLLLIIEQIFFYENFYVEIRTIVFDLYNFAYLLLS